MRRVSEPEITVPQRSRWRKKRYRFAAALLLIAAGVYVNNSSLLAGDPQGGPQVLAHRGVSQTFDMTDLDAETCTAERMNPPTHDHLENTLDSMRAAFDAGADLVEFDVHVTRDDQFAVFHDWEVDCRTEASGTTRDFTMDELRELDIGYGYTADNGKTYPFRGKGIGLMPSLDEVLDEFDRQPLLIHVKSDDPDEGRALAARLSSLDDDRLADITVYGGDAPMAALRTEIPELRVMSKAIMKSCLLQYEAMGWVGAVPAACDHTELHIPETYAPWLWGWPAKFVARMADAGTRVVLVAGSGEYSEGFDTEQDLDRIPDDYTGMVWTNRAEAMTELIHDR